MRKSFLLLSLSLVSVIYFSWMMCLYACLDYSVGWKEEYCFIWKKIYTNFHKLKNYLIYRDTQPRTFHLVIRDCQPIDGWSEQNSILLNSEDYRCLKRETRRLFIVCKVSNIIQGNTVIARTTQYKLSIISGNISFFLYIFVFCYAISSLI